jgi:hypothetical protein
MPTIEIVDNQVSIDKFLENIAADYTSKSTVNINGIQGVRVNHKSVAANGQSVILLQNNRIYNIYINSEIKEDIDLFEQIFSTFKLAE